MQYLFSYTRISKYFSFFVPLATFDTFHLCGKPSHLADRNLEMFWSWQKFKQKVKVSIWFCETKDAPSLCFAKGDKMLSGNRNAIPERSSLRLGNVEMLPEKPSICFPNRHKRKEASFALVMPNLFSLGVRAFHKVCPHTQGRTQDFGWGPAEFCPEPKIFSK